MPLTGEYKPSTSDWARKQAERFEASDGAEANLLRGKPIIVLTSIGAKTGALRKTALMRVEHEGRYLVVASKGGHPEPPAWYWNVRKNPHVELQDGAVKRDYIARELEGDERAEWWERALEVWPDYASYQERTERLIAVLLLEPTIP
jgi:deazaflavin-dependent oxidoreductase (nitroreductase family)